MIEQTLDKAVNFELSDTNKGWQMLMEAIETYQVDTGIPDLADQQDHYLYSSKRYK